MSQSESAPFPRSLDALRRRLVDDFERAGLDRRRSLGMMFGTPERIAHLGAGHEVLPVRLHLALALPTARSGSGGRRLRLRVAKQVRAPGLLLVDQRVEPGLIRLVALGLVLAQPPEVLK